jgi:hypothetical protein
MNHSFNSHRIRCISIIGGFLDGTKFELADGLNCFIGARGAGKTTMLEFVRYALDAMPSREEQPIERRRIESLVEKNLAGGRVEVTIETKDGMQYIVSRSSCDEPIVLTIDRQPTDISFRTGMVFGADIYSQNEVETIADCKASQLALLDKFQADSIAEQKSPSEAPCGVSVAPGIGDQLIGLFSHWRNQPWASMMVSGERSRMVFDESAAPATE